MSLYALVLGVGIVGLSMTAAADQSLGPNVWKVLSGRVVNGCVATDTFAAPAKQELSCTAKVERRAVCGGTEKSTYTMEFVAVLPNRRTTCRALDPAVDFFPASAFGEDDGPLRLLRRASKLLKRETSRPSSRFDELGRDVTDELSELQMAALDSVEVDTSNLAGDESYLLVFQLPGCRCAVALYISPRSSRYEWARLVE
jgi:hypothetical protein